MSNHLKQITTQAKRIRKSNPGLPWTECVSQASRDLGYGSSVGRKPKYRVYATEIKRKTKSKAKAKKVAPKPIVKAKAMPKAKPMPKPKPMPKAKPLVKAKKVYTKKEIDKVLDKIDPGKKITKPIVKAKRPKAVKTSNTPGKHLYNTKSPSVAIEDLAKGNIVEAVLTGGKRVRMTIPGSIKQSKNLEYWSITQGSGKKAKSVVAPGIKMPKSGKAFPEYLDKYDVTNHPWGYWNGYMNYIPINGQKPSQMTTNQYNDFQERFYSLEAKRWLWNSMIMNPSLTYAQGVKILDDLFEMNPKYRKATPVNGINQNKLDQIVSKYLVPTGLYAGQVKFRSKILYGEPIVLVETTSNQPIDKIYTDDYEEARLLAMVLNEKSEDLRKATMNGNVKKKIRNIGNITLK
jgi:hypothetical protein